MVVSIESIRIESHKRVLEEVDAQYEARTAQLALANRDLQKQLQEEFKNYAKILVEHNVFPQRMMLATTEEEGLQPKLTPINLLPIRAGNGDGELHERGMDTHGLVWEFKTPRGKDVQNFDSRVMVGTDRYLALRSGVHSAVKDAFTQAEIRLRGEAQASYGEENIVNLSQASKLR